MRKRSFIRCLSIIFFIWIILSGNTYSAYGAEQKPIEIIYDGQAHTYSAAPISLMLDGNLVETGAMPPIILQNYTLVPAREVFEAMGAVVKWDGATQEAYILMDDTFIVLQINNNIALVNEREVEMDIPAKLITNKSSNISKTMIPFRFVAETLGFDVEWENETRTVIANTPEKEVVLDEDQEQNSQESPDTADQENTEEMVENTQEDNDIPSNDEDFMDISKLVPQLPTELKDHPVVWETENEQPIEVDEKPVIEKEEYPDVNIENIELGTSKENLQQFIVTASGKISDVEYHTWNEKLILDITNATMKLKETNQELKDNQFVSGIRASQFEVSPQITRVVFDLNQEGQAYDVYLSPDRQQIFIDMMRNTITKVELGQNDLGDILTIQGMELPYTKIFRLTNPERIVIDMPYTISTFGSLNAGVMGQYVSEILTSQFTEDTMRIVLRMEGQPDYQMVSVDENTIGIQIIEPAYQNVTYHNGEKIQLKLKKDNQYPIDLSKIAVKDDYINKVYSITLPGNYSKLYGEGIIQVSDGAIESALIQKDGLGNTQITFFENAIYAYDISEDEQYIYFTLLKPKDKYNQIIVLDPGHGGSDPGARANGLIEKDLNLDISLRLNEYLEKDPNIKVYITRTTDTYPTLEERSVLANEIEADIFVSVHNNATASTKVHGTETLYHPLGDELGPDLTSKKMAAIFQDTLASRLNTYDRGIISRPELYVLRHTTMPAVILEIGYMTNKQEASILASSEYRQNTAAAIYEGIQKVFETYPAKR